jgi:cation-transporting P-type ATPase C
VISLGRHTLGVIRQNYGLAIGVNSLGIVAGAAGTLNPFAAAVLHNLSSLVVLLNSARLVRYRESAPPLLPRAGAAEETSRRRASRRVPRA